MSKVLLSSKSAFILPTAQGVQHQAAKQQIGSLKQVQKWFSYPFFSMKSKGEPGILVLFVGVGRAGLLRYQAIYSVNLKIETDCLLLLKIETDCLLLL
jgi:hypothetical protein